MYEVTLRNKEDGTINFVWYHGYDFSKAMEEAGLVEEEWAVVRQDYID